MLARQRQQAVCSLLFWLNCQNVAALAVITLIMCHKMQLGVLRQTTASRIKACVGLAFLCRPVLAQPGRLS